MGLETFIMIHLHLHITQYFNPQNSKYVATIHSISTLGTNVATDVSIQEWNYWT